MRAPSARLLAELRQADCSFFDYAIATARSHREYFESMAPLSAERHKEFSEESVRSMQQQRDIEARDEIDFDAYLDNYFASD